MKQLLDLTNVSTKRCFIVGELNGNYDILMRMLYEQRFSHNDTLIVTGDFFNVDYIKSIDATVFLRNSMNCYSVKGSKEIRLLENLENQDKVEDVHNKLQGKLKEPLVEFIKELPLIIKIRDYYIINAGVDPSKTLDEQDLEVFYSIGEYDKDSRFYQYPNPEGSSWYNTPYLVEGKHVKICFSKIYLDDIEVPAGYNLGTNSQVQPLLRTLILDKTQEIPVIIKTK